MPICALDRSACHVKRANRFKITSICMLGCPTIHFCISSLTHKQKSISSSHHVARWSNAEGVNGHWPEIWRVCTNLGVFQNIMYDLGWSKRSFMAKSSVLTWSPNVLCAIIKLFCAAFWQLFGMIWAVLICFLYLQTINDINMGQRKYQLARIRLEETKVIPESEWQQLTR